MTEHQRILLHLALIKSPPAATQKILSYLGLNLAHIYDMNEHDFVNLKILPKIAKKIAEGLSDYTLFDCELEFIEKYKIGLITLIDPDYPELLKNIHLPPLVLYVKGAIPRQQSLAVVGSREANAYAQRMIDMMVPSLVAHDWAIISGGALGADTMAHTAAVQAGGKTVAVLGSGLLRPYPLENKMLFEQIIDTGGAVVSSFCLLAEPIPEHFPDRNRIISGLSRGCLVVQAAAKSGARITADYTLSQGREVFAVPGNLWDPLSAGCHQLIQQGAKLTARVEDILHEYGQELIIPVTPVSHAMPAPVVRSAEIVLDDAIDKKIARLCVQPCSIDELLDGTGLPLIQITGRLFDLQLKGVLTQNMAGLWECR